MSINFDPAWMTMANRDERFWAFYKANSKDIEKILWAACWKFHGQLDPQELHNDLLIRLHRSNFFEEFDAKLAKFSTFVMGRIIGYARHHSTEDFKDTSRMPTTSLSDMDSHEEDEMIPLPQELTFNPDCEDELSCSEIMDLAEQRMTETQKTVWKHAVEGCNQKEIGKRLECSPRYIQEDLSKTKKIILKVCMKTGMVNKSKGKNGHTQGATRPLSVEEKLTIRMAFLKANGMIPEDFCLKIKEGLGRTVSIFQVTGIVAGLHRNVAEGKITVRDMDSYKKFIDTHRSKWATYKSARYQKRYGAASVTA